MWNWFSAFPELLTMKKDGDALSAKSRIMVREGVGARPWLLLVSSHTIPLDLRNSSALWWRTLLDPFELPNPSPVRAARGMLMKEKEANWLMLLG